MSHSPNQPTLNQRGWAPILNLDMAFVDNSKPRGPFESALSSRLLIEETTRRTQLLDLPVLPYLARGPGKACSSSSSSVP